MRNSSTWCPGTSSHGRQPKVLWCSCYDGFPWQRVRYMYRSSLMAIKINYVYVTCWVNIRSSHESKGPFRNFGCSDKDVKKMQQPTGPRSHGILLCHLWMMWLWEVALWKLLRFWLPILPSPASFPAVAVGEVGVIHPITSGMIAASWKLMLSSRFSDGEKWKICIDISMISEFVVLFRYCMIFCFRFQPVFLAALNTLNTCTFSRGCFLAGFLECFGVGYELWTNGIKAYHVTSQVEPRGILSNWLLSCGQCLTMGKAGPTCIGKHPRHCMIFRCPFFSIP